MSVFTATVLIAGILFIYGEVVSSALRCSQTRKDRAESPEGEKKSKKARRNGRK